jgi:hypothetical protein
MDVVACSMCVVAGAMSGAATGSYAARLRSRRRASRHGPGRTGRSWPGGRARPVEPPGPGELPPGDDPGGRR